MPEVAADLDTDVVAQHDDQEHDASLAVPLDPAVWEHEDLQAVYDLCCIFQNGCATPCSAAEAQLRTSLLRQVAAFIDDHIDEFEQCILLRHGSLEGFECLPQQMVLVQHALAKLAGAPYMQLNPQRMSRAYRKRYSSLRADFAALLGQQALQTLALEHTALVSALVALRDAVAALVLERSALFAGCVPC